jgi:uncharacterized membrane protein
MSKNNKKDNMPPVPVQENLPEDVNKVLEQLTEEQRRVLMGTMVAMEQKMYSGPLPPAEEIEAYERVCPGAADRIIAMTEKSLDHRIANEKIIVSEETKQSGRGQILGFALAVFFGSIALILGMEGHELLAGIIAGSDIVSLAVIFVLNKVPELRKGSNPELENLEEK